MTCSTCHVRTPFTVVSWQSACGRRVSWVQCFRCFNAEMAQWAREK